MSAVLHLTLKKEWFNQILSGGKTVEYRVIKPYWQKRLLDGSGRPKHFDFIIFKNGYDSNVPTMKVECKSIRVTDRFELLLGRIVDVKNLNV